MWRESGALPSRDQATPRSALPFGRSRHRRGARAAFKGSGCPPSAERRAPAATYSARPLRVRGSRFWYVYVRPARPRPLMERTANRSRRGGKALGGVLSGLCWLRLTASVFGCDVRVFLSYARADRNHRACRGHGPGCPPGRLPLAWGPGGLSATHRGLLGLHRSSTHWPASTTHSPRHNNVPAGRLSVCRSARRPVGRLLSCQFITSQHAALVRRACHSEFHTAGVPSSLAAAPHKSALTFWNRTSVLTWDWARGQC